MFSVNNQGLAV